MKYLDNVLLHTLTIVTIVGILLPKWANGILQFYYPSNVYHASHGLIVGLLLFLVNYLSGLSYYYYRIRQFKKIYRTLLTVFFLGWLIVINHILADQLWLLSHLASQQRIEAFFTIMEARYFADESLAYVIILFISSIALTIASIGAHRQKEKITTVLNKVFVAIFLAIPFFSLFVFYFIALLIVDKFYTPLPYTVTLILNAAFSLYLLLGLGLACLLKQSGHVKHIWLIRYTQRLLWVLIGIMMIQAIPLYFFIKVFLFTRDSTAFSTHYLHFIISLLPCIASVFLVRKVKRYISQSQFSDKSPTENTRGVFGTSEYANKEYLFTHEFYGNKGMIIGKDKDNHLLRFPLHNTTIISSPDGGKSTAVTIPMLLTENRPALVLDVKGELWATTARYRAKGFGYTRKVVVIDPFKELSRPEFNDDKAPDLLFHGTINPFDYISEDLYQRDRHITSLAQSLVYRDKDAKDSHWDDFAEIFISGLIDYMIKTHPPEERNLILLHDYLCQNYEETEELLHMMMEKGGQARAASAQLLKTAAEERGSIYSTTYRQVKWLVDLNLRQTFKESNFDLHEFLEGNMDIFILLPSDQIKFHNRVFRLIFTLTRFLMTQANIRKLTKKYVFILDELGQFDYFPDVEHAIEILRGRGAIFITAFQAKSQIMQYKKPDLFLNAKVKIVFEVDDEPTMKWIQTLGGEHDVLTHSKGLNQGDSYQAIKFLDGQHSKGESDSLQETKANLIPLNEIRELPKDQQYVFIRSYKTIKCYRAFYYNHPFFIGRFDPNPYAIDRE